MSEPYVGEIRCFGFNFAPTGWFMCAGQTLAIAQYTVLYSIIGTTYGGDGQTTFLLPNLQGNVPMHWGNGPGGFNTSIGQVQGTAYVTLTSQQMPLHQHAGTVASTVTGGNAERTPTPGTTTYIAESSPGGVWNKAPTINAPFSPAAVGTAGGSQPHNNMQPYLTVNFCICYDGIFPPRS